MSKTGFTPGRWRLSGPDDFGDFTIQGPHEPLVIAAVVNGNMREICGTSDEQDANAHLIAAAPELYNACRLALDAFESNQAINWLILEHALARARGETPDGR